MGEDGRLALSLVVLGARIGGIPLRWLLNVCVLSGSRNRIGRPSLLYVQGQHLVYDRVCVLALGGSSGMCCLGIGHRI